MDSVERIRTYEELVMGRVAKAFEAMDANNGTLFDELTDQIEMIFKLVPDLGEEFSRKKQYLTKLAQEAYIKSSQKIEKMEDEYMKRIQKEIDDSTISWDYRKDLIENALTILSKYNMIPFNNPVFAEIETTDLSEPEPEPEPEEVEPIEEPEPVETVQQRTKKKIKFRMRKANAPK